MIAVDSLRKRFGEVVAVDDISFSAADGAITGLLGPNGAGKSTTLRILCSVLRADEGSARIDGIDVGERPIDVRRRIGVLPHNAGLYSNLTVRENIAYFAALCGFEGAKRRRQVEAMLALLGIEGVADRRAKSLSQGERIRTALARALVHDPRTLILDEPTNGLDVAATRTLREIIRERRGAGCCVLFSSHVMQEVTALCDRIVVIADGKVALAGTPDEVRSSTGKRNLEDAFVAAVARQDGIS